MEYLLSFLFAHAINWTTTATFWTFWSLKYYRELIFTLIVPFDYFILYLFHTTVRFRLNANFGRLCVRFYATIKTHKRARIPILQIFLCRQPLKSFKSKTRQGCGLVPRNDVRDSCTTVQSRLVLAFLIMVVIVSYASYTLFTCSLATKPSEDNLNCVLRCSDIWWKRCFRIYETPCNENLINIDKFHLHFRHSIFCQCSYVNNCWKSNILRTFIKTGLAIIVYEFFCKVELKRSTYLSTRERAW